MNKPAKPEADDLEPIDDGLGPIPSEAEMDAWYERNREAIGELVAEALAETEPPTPWNPEEIMAEVREQLRKEGR
jgi:antitoxin ParD1/3/4